MIEVEGAPTTVLLDSRAINCTLECISVRLNMVEYMILADPIVLKSDGIIDMIVGIGFCAKHKDLNPYPPRFGS